MSGHKRSLRTRLIVCVRTRTSKLRANANRLHTRISQKCATSCVLRFGLRTQAGVHLMLSGFCGRFQENLFGDLWGCVRTGPNKSEMLCVMSVGAHLATAFAEHLAHLRLCLRFLQEALLKRSPESWTLRAWFTHCWVYLKRLSSSCSCDVSYIAGPLKL